MVKDILWLVIFTIGLKTSTIIFIEKTHFPN